MSVDGLLACSEVEIVLNLTVPAAHFAVSMAALSAGKHVFTEKPLATSVADGQRLVEEARSRGLSLACAPDTFLGAAGRQARRLVDAGAIGRPVLGTAFMLGHGMEHWHPAPQFYYQPGAGPALDMGPYYVSTLVNLLGPARRVVGVAATGSAEREITAPGATAGTRFPVGTPTTVLALIEFAAGAVVSAGFSWDVHAHSLPPLEIHGTGGSMRLPDPDTYGGTVELSRGGAAWEAHATDRSRLGAINWPFDAPRLANYRMLAVAEQAAALAAGRAPRASGALALHVLEILEAMLDAGGTGRLIELAHPAGRPAPLGEEELATLLGPPS
jgi:predicted dehydrogenase